MKAAFVHDHVFVAWNGRLYSPGRLPYGAWQRYLEHFDELLVVARVRQAASEQEVATMNAADGPAVRFVLVPLARGMSGRIAAQRELQRKLKNVVDEVDVVIARVPSEFGISACVLAHRRARLLAVEVVASAWHSLWYHGSMLAKVYAPIFEVRSKRAISMASFALYVTRDYLQQRYPCSGTVSSASNVAIKPDAERVMQGRMQRWSEQTRLSRIGFVGSLSARYKGLDVALQALAIIRRKGFDCKVYVAGDGDREYWLSIAEREGIAEAIEFVGSLPGSAAVQQWLDTMDIYLHPSRAEGLPRSLIEAMSRGCICFGSRVGGIPELLPDDCLHASGDWTRLAELLEGALTQGSSAWQRQVRRNLEVVECYSEGVLQAERSKFFGDVKRAALSRVMSGASVEATSLRNG